MTSSLLTPASALAALKNLAASPQGVRRGGEPDPGAAGRASEAASPAGSMPAAGAESYVTSLSEAIASGVGPLIHADMNVAAARLRALQAQKLLGAQAVSIANQHSQLVLNLFGG